jgi:dihydroorotase
MEELIATDIKNVCGIKTFMGSSTGNMLVDNPESLKKIFSIAKYIPVAVHCEEEHIIKANTELAIQRFGDNIPIEMHPEIRSRLACYTSSKKAVDLAKKLDTRLHILHLSTADEMALLDNSILSENKRITAEVCVHHLWFSNEDYKEKGNYIKWNPAIKSPEDREALWNALMTNKIDVIATDHAPHTASEKENVYLKSPSGGPLVQHSLVLMLENYHKSKIKIEEIVEKMCHNPAICFNVKNRGYIRPKYFADLVVIDITKNWTVAKDNILYKCGWSPLEGQEFNSTVISTFVNGRIVYNNGEINETHKGMALEFNR